MRYGLRPVYRIGLALTKPRSRARRMSAAETLQRNPGRFSRNHAGVDELADPRLMSQMSRGYVLGFGRAGMVCGQEGFGANLLSWTSPKRRRREGAYESERGR